MSADFREAASRLVEDFAAEFSLQFHKQGHDDVILWKFLKQDGLSRPIVIALSNFDELNFGVADFWSYFFPFEDVQEQFRVILTLWMQGNARIAVYRRRMRRLEVKCGSDWHHVYEANAPLIFKPRKPVAFISN